MATARRSISALVALRRKKLARYGRARTDGKSLSRTARLVCGSKTDFLFVADSGPGETNAKGLIVPRFGKNPENHVSVSMTFELFSELMLMTKNPLPVVADGILSAEPDKISDNAGTGNVCSAR